MQVLGVLVCVLRVFAGVHNVRYKSLAEEVERGG